MIIVSCRAGIAFRLSLDCKDTDPAIAIVKANMKAAAMNAVLDLQQMDTGYEVELDVEYLVAYEAP